MVQHFSRVLLVVIFIICCTVWGKISPLTRQYQNSLYATYLDTTVCHTVPKLTKSQIELCHQQPDTTLAALEGLGQAVKECQFQFQGHRWNCSALDTRGQNPYISAIFQHGYKETAFAYAIASAGVAISVARSCSQGTLRNCGCDAKMFKHQRKLTTMPPTTNWKWGGCSHNLHFGVKFSKMFLDRRGKAQDIPSKINLHNNQVGRMAVSDNMQLKCKCHGMSGSCELKTCWRAVPDYRIVGKVLKDKYKGAILIEQNNVGNKKPRKHLKNPKRKAKFKLASKKLSRELVYYEKSPNYCEKDVSLDFSGTIGRFCNRTNSGADSCSTLCCGRGYNLIKQKLLERCNCKFHWCCKVHCETCKIEKWISVCK